MSDLLPILIAALAGFFSGLLLSVPVGPVNLTIINEGARRGFRFALLVGIGASLMEVIYCSIAFTGFASFFSHGLVKAVMEVSSFVFLLFLGTKFLLLKSVSAPTPVEASAEEKRQPHSAFVTGFLRVLGNPGILLAWIFFSHILISRDWVAPNFESKVACILGVALGNSLWFSGLGYAVSLGHKKFSEQTLLRMERGSGIGLLLLGLYQGCQLIWQLAKIHHPV